MKLRKTSETAGMAISLLFSAYMATFNIGTVSGATGDWLLRTGVGESVESPAAWSDDENWRGGVVPSATGDGATSSDILALAQLMQNRVRHRFDRVLEPEICGLA